jgi:hypothetical protein
MGLSEKKIAKYNVPGTGRRKNFVSGGDPTCFLAGSLWESDFWNLSFWRDEIYYVNSPYMN